LDDLGDDNKAVAYAANATFTVIDSGPLVASLKVDSTAPGCTSLTRFYTVVDGLNEVLITDTLDKNIVHENEGVHLGFNFNVPNRVVRTDEPWSVVRPDIDQTEHANKSVYPVGRWVDVSNNEIGVTCANLDSPMMEIGAITQPRENDGGWLESSIQSSTIYWQVMNNYWHTNYKAYQAGLATFRYVVHPHASFDQAAVQRFGIGQSQPLIAVPIDAKKPDFQLPLKVSNVAVIVTACHPIPGGSAWMVRLFNSSNEPQTASVSWKTGTNLKCFQTNLWGNNDRPSRLQMNLSPMQIITLRLRPGIRGRNTVSNP
jgi:alpha-mannosidase